MSLNGILDTCFHLTNQCRRVQRRCDACQSAPPLFSFATKPRVGSSQMPSINSSCSCFAANFFQETVLACFRSIFFTSFGQTYFMCTCSCPSNIKVCHCGHFMPKSRVSHRTNNSCKCSRLSPCLNLRDLPSHPHSFCPYLRGHSRELFLHLKTAHFQEQGERSRLSLACCCCHRTLLEGFILLDERKSHPAFFLLAFSFAANLLTLVLKSLSAIVTPSYSLQ